MASELKKKLDSSTIDYAEYFPDRQELRIAFLNKSIYKYEKVPFNIYMGLIHAPSAGSYMWKNIRGKFTYKQI